MRRNLVLIRLPMLALGATIMTLGSAAAQTPSSRMHWGPGVRIPPSAPNKSMTYWWLGFKAGASGNATGNSGQISC
jgi:hypothetical protein